MRRPSNTGGRRFAGVLGTVALAALGLVVTAAGAGVTTQTTDVLGQMDPTRDVVAEASATLKRSESGLSAQLKMTTPVPGTYMYPPAQAVPVPFPAAVPGHPEAYSFWIFVFNYPSECSVPCDANDLAPAPALGGAFNAGGHIVGGPNLALAGHVSMNSEPFRGSVLLEPRTAEVHFAVAPHGQLDPALLPGMITLPIGSAPFWWIAVFSP